ncbi:MAG: TolC family protein [Bdellovibrionota bacterium]
MKRTIVALLTPVIFSSSAHAWGWKEAVNQAMDKNPSLRAQQQNEEAITLSYENARSLRYPRLTLMGTMQQYQNQTQKWQYRMAAGPRFQWLLWKGGQITSGIERAEALTHQADAAVRVTSVTTNFRLRQAFAQAIYAKNYLSLAHRIEQQRKDNVKLTEIRYQSGLEYKWVFLSSTAKWKKAQVDATRADMNKKTALADLENLLGPLPVASVENIEDQDFFDDSVEYSLESLIENSDKNPKIVLEQAQLAESEANIDYAKAEFYPEVALQADFWAMSRNQNALFPFWWTTLGVTMPLFEGGRIRRNVSIAKKEFVQRGFELNQAQLDIRADLQKNYQEYFISKQQVDISKLTVEANMDRAKVVSNQYRSGIASFLEWERSQDDWVNSEVELLASIRTYQIARARLEESIGVELR